MIIAQSRGRNGIKKIAAYVSKGVQVALTFRPQVSQAEANKRLEAALARMEESK